MYIQQLFENLEQIVVPDKAPGVGDQPDTENFQFLGTLDTDHRRLWMHCHQVTTSHNTLVYEHRRRQADVEESGNEKLVPAFMQLGQKIADERREYELLKYLFWFSIRHQYPELANKQRVSLFPDWRIGWSDLPDPEKATRAARLFLSSLSSFADLFA
ncbi:MAG TPA: hypothetical protein VJC05_01215 [Candidatus Andersenbacteria bacterium]|nr:MAG: hypothetical protein A2854_02035 [Parcubacteria group bacterium RIFCSPHIGHO2_01_FULL_56_18]HLD25646.1 hypothetical protein [Candidatus Andersenbacteria bacterium]